ncbi:hypothetical protein Pfo_002597 [Paulownia fortunei]|nr:hypothetical protein Pfo_002597 [Paulownia fortunei]
MGKITHILLLLSLIQVIGAVQYIVTNNAPNTPGGARFDSEIGVPWTIQTMGTINRFIWKLFQQKSADQRKYVPVLNVYISDFNDALGETSGDNINISTIGLQSFPPGRAKFEFTSLMYHEMTHIFQWSGKGTAPGGLTEGVADYVMIKSNYYDPDGYTKPGEGGRWDEGYGVTARFLEYCDSLRNGFTVKLNNKMREVYKDEYFLDLLGKPLDQVWSDYKAKYGNINAGSAGDVLADHVNGQAKGLPRGLTEGIADYVTIKSNYYDPITYTKPGEGSRWDEGYGVTARFLEYCDSLRSGFTVELNNKMREVYKDEYFLELLGKPLAQVWTEYKAKYGYIQAGTGHELSDHLQHPVSTVQSSAKLHLHNRPIVSTKLHLHRRPIVSTKLHLHRRSIVSAKLHLHRRLPPPMYPSARNIKLHLNLPPATTTIDAPLSVISFIFATVITFRRRRHKRR